MRTLSALFAAAVTLLSGCATISAGVTQSEQQPISISAYDNDARPVEKARCTLRNDKGEWSVEAPGVALVSRSNEDLMIECSKPGQAVGFARAISGAGLGLLGNAVFGGVIGAVIDHSQGTAYSYPESIVVRMGAMSTFDRRDETRSGYATPSSQTDAAAIALPRPGDRWTYRYVDAFKRDQRSAVVHLVLAVKPGAVEERMSLANATAVADQRLFTADHLRVVTRSTAEFSRAEFAPYLQSFKTDLNRGALRAVGALSTDSGADWDSSGRMAGREIVVVPAGSFDTVKVVLSGTRPPLQSHPMFGSEAVRMQHVIWYAPKVKRYVKYQVTAWDNRGTLVQRETFELVEFTVAAD